MITNRTFFLLAILLSASASACSNTYTVPLSLTNLNETTELVASKPTGPPTAHITSHADGLGWTVRCNTTDVTNRHLRRGDPVRRRPVIRRNPVSRSSRTCARNTRP